MTSNFIRVVTEADFEYEVIAYSNQVAVVVDFWAEWCRPCKSLTPLLEKLAEDAQGSYRLAKVNVDENPNLALRYSVRSIPNIKAFRDGQVVSEFLGLQPEPRVREFLRNIAPSQNDLLLEKGKSQLESMSWDGARESFNQFLAKSPKHPAGMLGLLKAYLMLGFYDEAMQVVDEFPASPEYSHMLLIQPLLESLAAYPSEGEPLDEPLMAALQNVIKLVQRGNIPAAMDGSIDILKQDKHFQNDLLRKLLLGLFEVLGENHPLTLQYRRELAMVLF